MLETRLTTKVCILIIKENQDSNLVFILLKQKTKTTQTIN